MKIVIIRHAEPDYEKNSLTEKGFKEARLLGKRYSASDFDYIYSSPLPRAVLTAEAVMKGEKEIKILPWLEEFYHPYFEEDDTKRVNWDFLPSYINKHKEIISDKYLEFDKFQNVHLKEEYEKVIKGLDDLLSQHGYKRNGLFYDVIKGNKDTIVLFCHFGMMSVILSHFFNIPYTLIAQFTVCQPSGVTVLVSEEREKGIAQFRMMKYGDISHLENAKEEASFHGRFCENFEDDTRH